jgi:hypothetical protein
LLDGNIVSRHPVLSYRRSVVSPGSPRRLVPQRSAGACSRSRPPPRAASWCRPRHRLAAAAFSKARDPLICQCRRGDRSHVGANLALSRRKQGFESPRERQGPSKPRRRKNNQLIKRLSCHWWYQSVVSSMYVGMGLKQNDHGVWMVRQRVPPRLREAVALVLDNGKERQTWLPKMPEAAMAISFPRPRRILPEQDGAPRRHRQQLPIGLG